jgi:hypothetical protein
VTEQDAVTQVTEHDAVVEAAWQAASALPRREMRAAIDAATAGHGHTSIFGSCPHPACTEARHVLWLIEQARRGFSLCRACEDRQSMLASRVAEAQAAGLL